MSKNKTSGVYLIFSKEDSSINYVGSSINIEKRIKQHIRTIKSESHRNKKMQFYFTKNGIDLFDFKILEYCDIGILVEREQFYIDTISPHFNILKTAFSMLGYKHSNEAKLKISSKNIGRKMTDEQVRKGVISRIGQRYSNGAKRTLEMRKHLSDIKKKPVYYKGQVYPSLKDVSDFTGIKYQTLYAMLSNRNTNKLNLSYA